MHDTLEFVVRHGYLLLFLWVLVEQVGLPVPALPLLVAAGALSAQHRISYVVCLGLAVVACVLGDSFWFWLGRRKGSVVLNQLCRISREPDSCVRRTESTFGRFGVRPLLISKFVPGFNTAAPVLSAIIGVEYAQFLLFDFLGGLFWSAALLGLGFFFTKKLDGLVLFFEHLGTWTLALFFAGVVLYILYKLYERKRFLLQVRGNRITPQELRKMIDARVPLTIIDLRHPLEVLLDPRTIPGALRISPEELEIRHNEITRDGEVVLFCT
jgi:membrane protein DedA with SNARE-associated domain